MRRRRRHRARNHHHDDDDRRDRKRSLLVPPGWVLLSRAPLVQPRTDAATTTTNHHGSAISLLGSPVCCCCSFASPPVCSGTFSFLFAFCFFPRLCIYCPAGRRGAAQPTKPLLLLRFLFSTTRGRRGGPRGAPRSLADVKVERRSEKRSVARGAGLWLLRTRRTIAAAGAFPTPPPLFAHTPRARPAHVRNATPLAAEKREVPGKFSSSRSLMSFVVGRQADWRRRDARDPLAAALWTKLRQRSSGVREDELTSGHAKTAAEAITP